MRATINKVNEALRKAGFQDLRIEKGNGYFYFYGRDTDKWFETGVYVFRLNQMTIEEWVKEALYRHEIYD